MAIATKVQRAAARVSGSEPSAPKTTRPAAEKRRPPSTEQTAPRIGRKLDAVPDRIDVRDWLYQPTLQPLPDVVVNCPLVPKILDQGQEGACTGFALAACINYQLAGRGLVTPRRKDRLVSPRMLYEMARRYDEWPGERYSGSSARGAMKGWVAHGVARQELWPDDLQGASHLDESRSQDAQRTPGGAYYRVVHRNIRDMHAAISETGILYATLMVHEGWDDPRGTTAEVVSLQDGKKLKDRIPVIARKGRADGGHAVAIVGYTADGFIVQNSWGMEWGRNGFALLPYEDWMLHATDCWVAQLGVPIAFDLWTDRNAAETTAGLQRAGRAIPLAEIRPYVIDIGNNGRLSDSGQYWTTPEDIERMFESVARTSKDWEKPRILLYLHGGLNSETAVARRIVAYKDACLANQIYPIHVMWETGFAESLLASVLDLFTDEDDRASAAWLKQLREGLVEARDRTIELTAAAPGGLLWEEMKENAELASGTRGGMSILAALARTTLAKIPKERLAKWELHVVAHSAGAVFAAHALELLANCGIPFKSLQLLAPALRMDDFKQLVLPAVAGGRCPHPTLYILSDVGERDDAVGPYGKSLLYLVSNAFEDDRATPILGMERFVSRASADPDKRLVDPVAEAFFQKHVGGLPSLVVAGRGTSDAITPSQSQSNSHGGFDNDSKTLNAVLYRILGKAPGRPFTDRDLQFE